MNYRRSIAKGSLLPDSPAPESRNGHRSHSATYPVLQVCDETGHFCLCRSMYFRKANPEPESSGLCLGVTGELAFLLSERHTLQSLNQTAALKRMYFHFFQNDSGFKKTNLSKSCRTRQSMSIHTTSSKINSLKTGGTGTGTDGKNPRIPK